MIRNTHFIYVFVLFAVLSFVLPQSSYGQNQNTTETEESAEPVLSTSANLSQLTKLFKQMYRVDSDNWRRMYSDTIKIVLYNELMKENSFRTNIRIPNLNVVKSDDRLVKVYTWKVPHNDGTGGYVCFIQTKDGGLQYYDMTIDPYTPKTKDRFKNRWYGCTYDRVVAFKLKEKHGHKKVKKTVYVLGGEACNNTDTQYKVVDVLTIDDRGRMEFGYPIFKVKGEKKLQRRVIVKYDAKHTDKEMKMRWDNKKHRFIFNHVEPNGKIYNNKEEAMSPAKKEYDCVQKSGKIWKLKTDVNR